MKDKTKKIVARVVCVMLASVLALTMLSPLLSLSAFATSYEIGAIVSDDKDVEIRVGGTPNPKYILSGVYYFWLEYNTYTTQVELYYNIDGGRDTVVPSNEGSISSENTVMRFNGIKISREDSKPFKSLSSKDVKNGDTGSEFAQFNEIGVAISINVEGSKIIENSGDTEMISSGGTIREGKAKNLVFTVIDPRTPHDMITEDSASVSFSSNAFALQSGKSPTAVPVEKEDGDAEFIVTIPVRYSGKGDAISFDIVYDAGELGRRIVNNTEKIPNIQESDDEDDDDDDDDDKIDPEPLTPYVIVESYAYGDGEVVAGEDFELVLTLKNTSKNHTLENIVMNIAPQGVFSMKGSSNTIYIDNLFAGKTVNKTVRINAGLTKVTDDEDANAIKMDFKFQYLVDKVRKNGESTENIVIPVTFPDRFELNTPDVEDMVYVGEEVYIYLPMVNKGRSAVHNVTAVIQGAGITNAGQTQYVGSIDAGSDSSADFAITYGEAGDFVGDILISYEDSNMEPKDATIPFEATVMAMEDFGGGMGEGDDFFDPTLPVGPIEPVEEADDPIKDIMLIVGGVIAVIMAYVTIQKAKAKRSIFTDEEF